MDFKDILYLSLASAIGGLFGILKAKGILNPKMIVAKLLASLIIGMFIIPAAMDLVDLSMRVWLAVTAIASISAEPVIELLMEKLKNKIKDK